MLGVGQHAFDLPHCEHDQVEPSSKVAENHVGHLEIARAEEVRSAALSDAKTAGDDVEDVLEDQSESRSNGCEVCGEWLPASLACENVLKVLCLDAFAKTKIGQADGDPGQQYAGSRHTGEPVQHCF